MNKYQPSVVIIVPTYNRRSFIPNMLYTFKNQSYPSEKLTMLIADDGSDSVEDLLKDVPQIIYKRFDEKIPLSTKRNWLNDNVEGDIIICWDDDDYYSLNYVKHVVGKLNSNKCIMAGSSTTYQYYPDTGKIYSTPFFGPNHTCNGMTSYKKEYLKTHRYEDGKSWAEEKGFMNNYDTKVVQLNKFGINIVVNHSTNTYDRISTIPGHFTLTKFKLKDFIKDKTQLNFFKTLSMENLKKEILISHSSINKAVDKVVVLTTEKRRERWQYMYHQFKQIGIYNYDKKLGGYPDVDKLPKSAYSKIRENSRMEDKDYIRGVIGCKISHRDIIQDAVTKDYESVLILEDDVKFLDGFEETFKNAMEQVKDLEWDMLYLGGRHQKPVTYESENIVKMSCTYGAYAYIVHKRAYPKILNYIFHEDNGTELDTFYAHGLHANANCYCIYPHIVEPEKNESDVYGKEIDYVEEARKIEIISKDEYFYESKSKYYLDRLKNKDYFTYSRFANYEFMYLTSNDFTNCDKHEHSGPLSVDLRQVLENRDNIDKYASKKYIYHSPDYDSKYNELFKRMELPKKLFTKNDFLKDMLVDQPKDFKKFVKYLNDNHTLLVGPSHLSQLKFLKNNSHIETELNAFKSADELDVGIRNYLEENEECRLIMFACGPATNCLLDRLHEDFGETHFMIDVGSLFDNFIDNNNIVYRKLSKSLSEIREQYDGKWSIIDSSLSHEFANKPDMGKSNSNNSNHELEKALEIISRMGNVPKEKAYEALVRAEGNVQKAIDALRNTNNDDDDTDNDIDDLDRNIEKIVKKTGVSKEKAFEVLVDTEGSVSKAIKKLGGAKTTSPKSELSEDEEKDINIIMNQTNLSMEDAIKAYNKNDKDVVSTILEISNSDSKSELSEDEEKDINIIMNQTNLSREDAIKAYNKNDKDVVSTILETTM